MAEFEDKLNSILSNPALMGQIMSMAGSLGQSQEPPPPPPKPEPRPQNGGFPFDPGAMQNMMQLLQSTQIDRKEQNLINALQCYLPPDRLEKLTKAMQAAKIARFASTALAQGGK